MTQTISALNIWVKIKLKKTIIKHINPEAMIADLITKGLARKLVNEHTISMDY